MSAADSSKGKGVVLRPPELSREEIQAEVLKLLHQHTASFVSSLYSVHIETRGSRQLAAFLKGHEAELGAQDPPPAAYSMLQQTAGELTDSSCLTTVAGRGQPAAARVETVSVCSIHSRKPSVRELWFWLPTSEVEVF